MKQLRFCLLLALLFFVHGFSGPFPGCFLMGSRVPIPGCFTFFTAIWRVFHQPNPMISMPTSPSELLLLFTPWNQLNFDVTGFKNTQASRDNRSCHFHAQLESSITLLSTDSVALALSRASPCRLNDAFNVMSFLHGINAKTRSSVPSAPPNRHHSTGVPNIAGCQSLWTCSHGCRV